VRVTGVEAEPHPVADRVPEPRDRVEVAGHGMVAPGGVLEKDRHRRRELIERFHPPVDTRLDRVVGSDVAAVDDDAAGLQVGRGVAALLEDLAAGDADLVVW